METPLEIQLQNEPLALSQRIKNQNTLRHTSPHKSSIHSLWLFLHSLSCLPLSPPQPRMLPVCVCDSSYMYMDALCLCVHIHSFSVVHAEATGKPRCLFLRHILLVYLTQVTHSHQVSWSLLDWLQSSSFSGTGRHLCQVSVILLGWWHWQWDPVISRWLPCQWWDSKRMSPFLFANKEEGDRKPEFMLA